MSDTSALVSATFLIGSMSGLILAFWLNWLLDYKERELWIRKRQVDKLK